MMTVPESISHAARWAAGILRADLGKSLIVSASTGLLLWFGKRLWGAARRGLGRTPPPTTPEPEPTWPPDRLAEVYSIDKVRDGLVVAPATRLVVVDGGMKQFTLDPGTHSARDVKRLLDRHAVQKSGVALQYATTPLEIHAGVSASPRVATAVVLEVRVDETRAEKILDWVPLRDGVAEGAEVKNLIEEKVRPWLQERLGALQVSASSSQAGLKSQLEPFLNEQVFRAHGLEASIRSVANAGPDGATSHGRTAVSGSPSGAIIR